jgi:hypothetical protein
VVLGVVVTRLTARQVEIQRGLSVPRLEEKFVIRIQGRGPGLVPKLTNYVTPSNHLAQPLLPFVDDDDGNPQASDRNLTQLRSVLFASAAFPVAFAPQPIEYCLSKPPREGEVAGPKNVACAVPEYLDLFVDGGVFDNNPLRLAYLVAENHLTTDAEGKAQWRDALDGDARTPNQDVVHLYLDPDTSAYPPEVDDAPVSRDDSSLVTQFFKLGGGFVDSARAKELSSLAAERRDLATRMRLTVTQYPTASEHLSAFVGFFERDFRLFDFYLGMYDAYRELKDSTAWSGAEFDVDALVAAYAQQSPAQWRPFTCLLAMVEPGHEQDLGVCQDEGLAHFRVLLQVSIDRLYEACRPTPRSLAYAISGYHQHCSRSRQGYSPPQVPGVNALDERERVRKRDETSFDYAMRLMADYHYEFTDLGLKAEDASYGRLAIRHELDDLVSAWAEAQTSFADRLIAKTAGRVALNNIEFSPPWLSGHVVVGTVVEGGVSFAPFAWKANWFQLTAALELNGFFTILTPGEQRLAFDLVAGPEFHISALSNAVLQPRVALRGGVQLGVRDAFGGVSCSESSDPRWCTQGVVELVVSLTLFERIRGQVIWQHFPRQYGHDPRWYNLQFGIGLQFD